MASGREENGQILQSSLESILSGQDTLDSILVKYPDLAEWLRPELELALWLNNLKGTFDPRPGHVPDARRRLVARIQTESPRELTAARPPARGRSWERWRALFSQRRLALQFAIVLMAVIILSLFSSGIVLASQNSVPGDPFYPVKIVQEQVQVAASFSAARETRLHIRFAERRLFEIQTLILENRFQFIPETVELYEGHLAQATASLEETARQDLEQAKALSASLQEMVLNQTPILSVLSEVAPPEVRSSIAQTLQISDEAFVAAQEILAEQGGGGPGVLSATPSPTSTLTPGGSLAPTGTPVPGTSLAPLDSPAPSEYPASTAGVLPGEAGPVPTGTATPSGTYLPDGTQAPAREPTPASTPEPQPTKELKPEKSKTPPGLDKTNPPPPETPPGLDKTQQPPPNPPPNPPPGQDKTREPPPNPPPETPPGLDKTQQPPPGLDKTKELPPGQASKTAESTP